ncbi:MAG: pyridoxamine 5'-phosphate oxidase family protein [Acidimicrobiales bacterium]
MAARNLWIATTRRDGRPDCRPVWGAWLRNGFWFSTGSLARRNLAANPQITVHLRDGHRLIRPPPATAFTPPAPPPAWNPMG